MPCDERATADGRGVVIVCSRGRRKVCAFCKATAPLLCDGPAPAGSKRKTCDAPLCRAHATHVGRNRDLCPTCAAPAPGGTP